MEDREKAEIALLNGQEYKEYFYNTIFVGYKIIFFKIIVAFIFSFVFDFFDLFVNYNFFISYVLVEVLYFNVVYKTNQKP